MSRRRPLTRRVLHRQTRAGAQWFHRIIAEDRENCIAAWLTRKRELRTPNLVCRTEIQLTDLSRRGARELVHRNHERY